MDYQIWTKEEYAELWIRKEAGDLPAAKRLVLAASKEGKDVVITILVPFEFQLKVGEPGEEPKTPKETKKEKVKEKGEEGSEHETNQDKPE